MKLCLDFNERQLIILKRICLDNNYSGFIQSFLQKNLFDAFNSAVVAPQTPSYITYYNETARLIKLVGLTQSEIASQLGFSQQAIGKAFKIKNENSVIFRAMQQHGSPDNFVFDIYTNVLNEDEQTMLFVMSYSGDIFDFLKNYLNNYSNIRALHKFIILLSGFARRLKPRQYDPDIFFKAVCKLNKQLFLDFDIFLVYDDRDIEGNVIGCMRSAEKLYTALEEYYLSLEL